MSKTTLSRVGLVAVLGAALIAGTAAFAKRPGGGGGGGTCPKNIQCTDVWDPVQCADGIVYSNMCYADRACAPTPCQPTGGGPVEL